MESSSVHYIHIVVPRSVYDEEKTLKIPLGAVKLKSMAQNRNWIYVNMEIIIHMLSAEVY